MFVKDTLTELGSRAGETQETYVEALKMQTQGSGQPGPAPQTVLRMGDSVS